MTHPPARSTWLRRTAAYAGAGCLVLGAAAAGLAQADAVDSEIAAKCALGTYQVDVNLPVTLDDTDPVAEGAAQTVVIQSGLPDLPAEVTVNKVDLYEPIPEEVASIDSVTFSGGNVSPSYTIDGHTVVITFTGPISSKEIQMPTITIVGTMGTGIAPTTMTWVPFTQVVADTNVGVATCTPNDPGQVLNTTEVTEASAPTTEPPTSEPPTSEPPATTPPTSQPPTSEPPTSEPPTSEPPTSEPPSTAPPSQPSAPGLPPVNVCGNGVGVAGSGSTADCSGLPSGGVNVCGNGVGVAGTGSSANCGSGGGSQPPSSPPSTPGVPGLPTVPGLPGPGGGVPSVPGAPSLPAPGEVPSVPGAPSLPAPGEVPSVPGVPSLPGPGEVPSVPGVPGVPAPGGGVPSVPGVPALPGPGGGVPSVPGAPTVPSCASETVAQVASATPLPADDLAGASPISRSFPQPGNAGAGILALAGTLLVSVSLLLRRMARRG